MTEHDTAPPPAIHQQQQDHNALVLSFLAVRRAIGILGFFLPLALWLWSVTQPVIGILPTMSDYFYTPVGVVFVGTLTATAVFLWSYEGYRKLQDEMISDLLLARVASLGALGTAWVPTTPPYPIGQCPGADTAPVVCTFAQQLLTPAAASMVHLVCAAAFFGALALFCLVQFTRGPEDSAEKRASNRIYRICGWTIVGALAGIGAIKFIFPDDSAINDLSPVFWLEVVACLAFATSWAVKGDALRPLVRMAAKAG